jgi:hypothetical protein
MVRKHSKQHDMEVSLSEFCEMMEDQTYGGRAWFLTAACVLIPDMDYDHEILAYREEEKNKQFEIRTWEVFEELQNNDIIQPEQMEVFSDMIFGSNLFSSGF